MLNELLVVERGAHQAGIEMTPLHPDIKDAQRAPTLLIRLAEDGHVASVLPVPRSVKPWTLRDGQHNSFPFVQPKQPLWAVPEDDEGREKASNPKSTGRREALIALAHRMDSHIAVPKNWPGDGLLRRLHERRQQMASLDGTDAAVLLWTIDRFLLACEPPEGDPQQLLVEIAERLVEGLQRTTTKEWVDVAVAVLIKGGGAFLFEATGDGRAIFDRKLRSSISTALMEQRISERPTESGCCALTGRVDHCVTSTFPQPNLPLLGQTFLFARNRDTPANQRYGHYGADTMPVDEEVADRLAAAATALTAPEREGKTWRSIPGEAPKQTDLLLAFVQGALEAEVAGTLADDDFSEEERETNSEASSVAAFEKRTERLIESLKARIGADFRRTPVHLVVLRRVDPANRKVIFSDAPTVDDLFIATVQWREGEQNTPPWLTLRVLRKGERTPRPMFPPHVAPLGVIALTKQLFIRGGTARQEALGLSAPEALDLFLDCDANHDRAAQRRAKRVLRMVLIRRTALVSGAAHALRRSGDAAKAYDRWEALRTITILGVLLYKLNPIRGGYMSDPAFRLGQLLAAADVVHAGYCADLRDGDVPPSLLGNQVFTMAQTAPAKALAVLCRRWKPYAGWAKRSAPARKKALELINSKEGNKVRRGWDILRALRHAREMGPLADELASSLTGCRPDDAFRAELLLGYVAGLPKVDTDRDTNDNAAQTMAQED